MSYFDDPLCEAAALAEHACIAIAVDFEFPSGHVRVTTWPGGFEDLDGNAYTDVGNLGSVSEIADHATLTTERWVYRLAGVDPSVVPESEINDCFGLPVIEYEVWLNPETHAVIGFEIRREGTMGRVYRIDGREPVIEVNCETRLIILEHPDGWRNTSEHQAQFFPGDTGYDEVRKLDSKEIIWGGQRQGGDRKDPRLRGRV